MNMDRALEQLVWSRAKFCCEYCRFPFEFADAPFQIDHIIALKHEGLTIAANLALSRYYCNSYKGSNIAGIDPKTGKLVRLFHPRRDRWKKHFVWNGGILAGRTGVARATVAVLWMNHPTLIQTREILIEGGLFPPVMTLRK
jgi:hypothetical protein